MGGTQAGLMHLQIMGHNFPLLSGGSPQNGPLKARGRSTFASAAHPFLLQNPSLRGWILPRGGQSWEDGQVQQVVEVPQSKARRPLQESHAWVHGSTSCGQDIRGTRESA